MRFPPDPQVPGCTAPCFEESDLAQSAKDAFALFMKAKLNVAEQQIVADMEARVAADRAAEMNASERHRRKLHICEKILTLTCPRCSQAFLDFDGCMALKCSRAGCGCGFCAICQKVLSLRNLIHCSATCAHSANCVGRIAAAILTLT